MKRAELRASRQELPTARLDSVASPSLAYKYILDQHQLGAHELRLVDVHIILPSEYVAAHVLAAGSRSAVVRPVAQLFTSR